jgi:hypothetical protein
MWSSLLVSYIECSDGGVGTRVVVLLLLLGCRYNAWPRGEDLECAHLSRCSMDCIHIMRQRGCYTRDGSQLPSATALDEVVAALDASTLQHTPTRWRRVALEETMAPLPANDARLVCPRQHAQRRQWALVEVRVCTPQPHKAAGNERLAAVQPRDTTASVGRGTHAACITGTCTPTVAARDSHPAGGSHTDFMLSSVATNEYVHTGKLESSDSIVARGRGAGSAVAMATVVRRTDCDGNQSPVDMARAATASDDEPAGRERLTRERTFSCSKRTRRATHTTASGVNTTSRLGRNVTQAGLKR